MAFSSLKPCSRLVRCSPHQTDQQQKEVYYLLQDHQQQHQEEEEAQKQQRKEHFSASPNESCDEPAPLPSTASEPSCQEELPTFIAHQGSIPLKLQQKNECKHDARFAGSTGWFRKEQYTDGQHLCPFLEKDPCPQSFLHRELPPLEVSKRAQKLSFMRTNLKRQIGEQDPHNKQYRGLFRKNACASSNIYGITLEQAVSMRQDVAGVEKRRNSSASAQDMISVRQSLLNKGRCHDDRPSSWEEEVRQVMARSLIGKKQDEEVHGLQRSTSVKDYDSSTLPPRVLLVKTTEGSSQFDDTAVDLEAGSKTNERAGHPLRKSDADKWLWRGFNVKSPREERWEEAAEVEEQQELQRRARSQSMRYDTSQFPELMAQAAGGPWDTTSKGNAAYHDDEWAVYKKSGYVNVRPRSSGNFAQPACCSSMLGRSLSMRDTRMGLVMECAACGAALHGTGGRLLCFCSCCAVVRSSSLQGGAATVSTKKKGGILRACRRLLGLGKKYTSHT